MTKAYVQESVKRRKSEITRDRLVEAAHVVFSRDPYPRVKVTEICEEAGKSAGVFYRYFTNKEDIFAAALEQFLADLKELSPHPDEFEHDPLGAMRRVTRIYWETYVKYKGVMNGLFLAGSLDPAISKLWRQMHIRGIKQFAHRIRAQQKAGLCVGLDPEVAASAMLFMFEFSCYQWTSNALQWSEGRISDEVAIDNLFLIMKNAMML